MLVKRIKQYWWQQWILYFVVEGICIKNKNDQGFVIVYHAAYPGLHLLAEINFNPSMNK